MVSQSAGRSFQRWLRSVCSRCSVSVLSSSHLCHIVWGWTRRWTIERCTSGTGLCWLRWSWWHFLPVYLNGPLNEVFDLTKPERLLNAEAGVELRPASIRSLFLYLREFVACFLYSFSTDPACHNLCPILVRSLVERSGGRQIGIRADDLSIDVSPFVLSSAKSPRDFEIKVAVPFLSFDCCCCFYR